MDHIPERDRFVNAGWSKHNDPVDVVGHHDEGVESDSGVVLREFEPDVGDHLAGRTQTHFPGDDTAE